eukprot:TCONS_00050981-protein
MLGFIEWLLICLPLAFHSFTLHHLTLLTTSFILTLFGRSQSNLRWNYQSKMELLFRCFSDDGFVYPIVVFPTFFCIKDSLQNLQGDSNGYFYAVMTSTLFAVFGFFVCFGPLMTILLFATVFIIISPTITTGWFIVSLATIAVYFALFFTIVRHSPNSFTFGEAGLITQVIGYVLMKFTKN